MKITVIGGGPGGLYFSILTKKRMPNAEINVYEQNKAEDAFGFGVVFSDETLSEFLSSDERSYELIRNSFAYWDNLDVVRDGETVRIEGNGFCGCSRKTLLVLLQQRCKEENVHLHFETEIDDLSQFAGSDIIVAADGIGSSIRQTYAKEFGTEVTMMSNRFIWCGSTKPLDAFTYFFRNTPHGAFCAHTYQYEDGKSTWIFECTNETYQKAGFQEKDEEGSIAKIKEIYKEELEGHDLITNRSWWRQFPHVYNKNWHTKNIVLLGDSKATAHYSIGSGTKLAMDCAIGLSDAIVANQTNVQKAFEKYTQTRRNIVDMIQHAADVSLQWFENMNRHMKLDFDTFSFSTMSRSKKITIENQARRDPQYSQRIISSYNKNNGIDNRSTPPAFSPYKLGSILLENKIAMSPMGQYSAKNGIVNDWHLVHYGARATGGVGLIIAEMTAISKEGRITFGCAGLWNNEQMEAWKKVTTFVHKNSNTKIGIQIGHSGRKGSCEVPWKGGKPLLKDGWDLISASPIPFTPKQRIPKEVRADEMNTITAQFVNAAKKAKEAKFDLVEIQAHHGFLLASFLSPLTNNRKDEYGGNIKNRAKFPLKVIVSVSEALGKNFPLSVRISATDWHKDGIKEADILYFSEQLKKIGVDIINVSTGNTVADQKPITGRMWQSNFSELIKNQVNIPTITAGNIQDIDQINTLLLNKRADLIALGRPLLISPSFVRHSQAYENHNASELNKIKGSPQYDSSLVALYNIENKKRKELKNIKIALKPKSHKY